MKGLAITLQGIEDIAASEIEELIKAKAEIRENVVTFEFKKYEDLFFLCYKSQSASRIVLLLSEFEASDLKNSMASFEKNIPQNELKKWVDRKTSFKVICQRIGMHEFSSQDFAAGAGAVIAGITKAKVNLVNPNILFYCFISGNKGYFGIDFAGFDLSKREYNIFTHPVSINPCLAYALVRLSKYDKKGAFLDAFAKSGLIAIEAALYSSGFPVNHYRKDKFAFLALKPFSKFNFEDFFSSIDRKAELSRKKIFCTDSGIANVRAAEKNAKIAGVNKIIDFSRFDVSWLDTKFKKNSIYFVATVFHFQKDSDNEKTLKEFFYQMEYILNKNGRIAIMAKYKEVIEKYAAEYKFRLVEKREITRGNEKSYVLVFGK